MIRPETRDAASLLSCQGGRRAPFASERDRSGAEDAP